MYLARSIAHTLKQLLMIINVDFAHAHKSEVRPPTHVYVAKHKQSRPLLNNGIKKTISKPREATKS